MLNDPWIQHLNEHFLEKEALASECKISVSQIDQMIKARAMPEPSYVLKNRFCVESHINSVSDEKESVAEYFPKAIKSWVLFSAKEIERSGLTGAACRLESHFRAEYEKELEKWGVSDPLERSQYLDNTWHHFLKGTYGVCVKDISQISHIASKQFSAQKLADLTENGQKQEFDTEERKEVKAAIEEYNKFTAAFGPWEYEKTSRKRLVDDVLPKLTD